MAEQTIRRTLDAVVAAGGSRALTELLLMTSEAAWQEVETRAQNEDHEAFVARDPDFFGLASRCRRALDDVARNSPSEDEAQRVAVAVVLQRLTLLVQLHNDVASYYQMKSSL